MADDYQILFSNVISSNEILSFLAEEDLIYIERFNNLRVRAQSATARYKLRKWLFENFPNNYQDFKICTDEFGKPYFSNTCDLHFSISHSGNQVAILLSKSKCGLDLESVKTYRKDVAERFFLRREYAYLESIKDINEQTNEFYRIWTVKEAFLKLGGRGIAAGLSSFYLDEDGQIINNYEQVEDVKIISEKRIFDGVLYYCSVAVEMGK